MGRLFCARSAGRSPLKAKSPLRSEVTGFLSRTAVWELVSQKTHTSPQRSSRI
jgi:hypothetical protein